MAEALKHSFDAAVIRSIATSLHAVHPPLRAKAFVAECLDGLDDRELIARGGHVADVMRRHLPESFPAAAAILVASLGPALDRTEGDGMTAFRYLPHATFVGRYGLAHFEPSMRAQHALTQRFTAEWSIRPFLVAHPARTHARLRRWASDRSVHVRRLVSEGTRPRLPWAPRLRAYQEDPAPVLELLELLKDDPERYVQRSVANNLGDIAKDHPDVAVDVCRRWSKAATPSRTWIVNHALRSLIKAGHAGALATVGYGAAPSVTVAIHALPRRVTLGDTLRFSFDVASTAARPQELLVDYAVHFVKASGARSAKVFKLRKVALAAGERARLDARVSFAAMTTRTPRPGLHRIDALVNGQVFALGEVDVV